MPGVVVVTDSTSSLGGPRAVCAGVRVVPLQVVVAGRSRAEDQVEPAEIAQALRDGRLVSTSRPAPELFAALYAELVAEGYEGVVSAHLSGRISGTVDAATLAAAAAPLPVRVVDTGGIGMATGYAVLAGASAARTGAGLEAVAATVSRSAAASTTYFYVNDLTHLRRGGRLGAATAVIGSVLAVKSLLTLVDGEIRPQERIRTTGRALDRLRDLTQAAVARAQTSWAVQAEGGAGGERGVAVAVHHLDDPAAARRLVALLGEGAHPVGDVEVVELGAVLGVHTGPGALGVVVAPVV